jgi:hypothetical protein
VEEGTAIVFPVGKLPSDRQARYFPPAGIAPSSLHRLVNWLHLIELQADAISAFYLTLPIEGVETYSFFDSF